MTMCASAINRDEFSAGPLNGSDWVFGPGELRGADDQRAYEGREVRSENFREAAASLRPTSGSPDRCSRGIAVVGNGISVHIHGEGYHREIASMAVLAGGATILRDLDCGATNIP